MTEAVNISCIEITIVLQSSHGHFFLVRLRIVQVLTSINWKELTATKETIFHTLGKVLRLGSRFRILAKRRG